MRLEGRFWWRAPRADASKPSDDDISALRGFANQAGIALKLSRAQQDRAALGIAEDRDRIARDLHDVVVQRLFAAGLVLQGVAKQPSRPDVVEKLTGVISDLDRTIYDIRSPIFELGHGGAGGDVRRQILEAASAAALERRPNLMIRGPVNHLIPEPVIPHLVACSWRRCRTQAVTRKRKTWT
jgi:signal transduction histidine kinase